MKYVSLFAGIGGFDLALNRLGHECVYVNEWDKYAAATYEKNFCTNSQGHDQAEMDGGADADTQGGRRIGESDTHLEENVRNIINPEARNEDGGDEPDITRSDGQGGRARSNDLPGHPKVDTRSITDVSAESIPDHDLLVGGFPCQAFSIAGKRRGFDDTRGTLFFEIARILKDKRSRYFLLENVKGLLSHDKGKTFQTILGVLADLGYEYSWQVCNSKNFGVPQNRERVFIVGHLRGERKPKVFSLGKNDELSYGKDGQLHYIGGIAGKRDKWLKDGKENSRNFSQGQRVYDTSGIASTLAGNAGGLGGKTGLYAIPVLTPDRLNKRQNGRRMKEDGDSSFALTAQDRHGVYDGIRIRRLTPIECERLQGFPDNWTQGVSDTQRYKQLGNAVTVNVVEEIAKCFSL